MSFSEPGAGGAGTAVACGRLGERGLEDTRVIWRQHPKVGGSIRPVITYGVDYSGARIGVSTARPGMEQPVYYWDPGDRAVGRGVLHRRRVPRLARLVGSLSPGGLVRLRLADGRVTGETRYTIEPGERVRDVRQGPDGLIYLVTDNPRGRIVRLAPR